MEAAIFQVSTKRQFELFKIFCQLMPLQASSGLDVLFLLKKNSTWAQISGLLSKADRYKYITL